MDISEAPATHPPRVLPPHYFVLAIGLIVGLGLLTGPALNAGLWRGLGLIPMALGVWVAVAASNQFQAAGTNIIPLTRSDALVTDGMFRLSRNPMYAGMLAFLAGLSLLMDTPWGWLVTLACFVLLRGAFVKREERLMEATFGDEYRNYCAKVRRWINPPGAWPRDS